MVDLTRGMRPQLNLNALVIFTMQLPLSAHSHSHYYDHILYEIQIQIHAGSVCVCVCWCLYCVHLITNFCCRLLSETLTSSSLPSSSFRVSHSHSRFSVGFFALLLFQYAIYKQTNIRTHNAYKHTDTYIHTYVHV